MKSGIINLYGREYFYNLHFGKKSVSLMEYNPKEEKFQWSTVMWNWEECPRFIKKALGVAHV